jgi:two-component system sensor histidine kinase VicK
VRDTGIGIPPELKDRVFDKFSSSKRTGLNGEEPHGMGLWAVKTMVEWMGGDIRVDSTVGHGTEFRIVLPITQS